MNKKIQIVILAAGKGKRMKSDVPKALVALKGKPMIEHLLQVVHASGVDDRPIIVIGHGKEAVKKTLGSKYEYVVQEKQLGTGHALASTEKILKNNADHVLVLYADSPLLRVETIKNLVNKHLESKAKMTMATVTLPDFADWRAFFYKNFSRIVRDKNGRITKDVQFKDASEEEKKIKEVNPCYFIFDAKWLWRNINKLKNKNAQGEYYLTDLIKMACNQNEIIETVSVYNQKEALQPNSKEELELLEKLTLE